MCLRRRQETAVLRSPNGNSRDGGGISPGSNAHDVHRGARGCRSILRMICARLGVICKEHTTTDISPYGAKAVLNYDVQDQKRWSISFTNTPERQEFLIEAV